MINASTPGRIVIACGCLLAAWLLVLAVMLWTQRSRHKHPCICNDCRRRRRLATALHPTDRR